MQQGQQVSLIQRFQHIDLATREQRPDHFERGILRGGTNQGHDSCLHRIQQRILLRLAETMNLINKEDWRDTIKEAIALRLLYHLTHILHARTNRTQRIEGRIQPLRDNLRQGCLSHTRRTPQDK